MTIVNTLLVEQDCANICFMNMQFCFRLVMDCGDKI